MNVAGGSGPLWAQNNPNYTYGNQTSGGTVMVHLLPDQLDLKSESLQSTWFQLQMYTADSRSFKLFIIYHNEILPPRIGVPGNATLGQADPERIILPWELKLPWTWQLFRSGEYPWDEYSLIFILAFNRTVNVKWVTSSVSPVQGIIDQWTVVQGFERLDTSGLIQEKLHWLGFSQAGAQGFVSETGTILPSEVLNYPDFYALTITFVRQPAEIARGIGAFWAPGIALSLFLILAIGRIKDLETRDGITVFLGMALATMPFILGALQFLPPRITSVEVLLYLEMIGSILLACFVVGNVKRKARVPNGN
jgi:hypothetical protein